MHQDDGLEGGAAFVGQLVERFLLGPAPLQQRAAHHAGRLYEAGAEAQGHVRGGFGAAAARQVDLKPAGRAASGQRNIEHAAALTFHGVIVIPG